MQTFFPTATPGGFSQVLGAGAEDANGHRVNRFTDAWGQLVLVREVAGEESAWTAYADTVYTYDVAGNLLQVETREPADNASGTVRRRSTMTYDALGRKMGMDDADMGAWSYAYDTVGNLVRQQDAQDQAICFYYDGLNRLLRKTTLDSPTETCPALESAPTSGTSHLARASARGRLPGGGRFSNLSPEQLPACPRDGVGPG